MHATPGGAHEAGWRHVHVAQPFVSCSKPSLQATLQRTCGQVTAWLPAGQVLHWHVGHPFASSAGPLAHIGLHPSAGQVAHEGGCHTHLPSAPRVHAAGVIGPVQFGRL
jgi:hypothetical protein